MPGAYMVPLKMSSVTVTLPVDREHMHLPYRAMPTVTEQPVTAGRVQLVPAIELNDYDCRAVIDWLELLFVLSSEVQATEVYQYLKKNCGFSRDQAKPFVSGPDRRMGYKGRDIVIRLQDATPALVRTVTQAMGRGFELETSLEDEEVTRATDTPGAVVCKQIDRFSSSVQSRFVRRAITHP